MIDDIRLRRIAVDEGVPLGTIEKDLAITCALYALSKTGLRDHLIFKGGTAIKKTYQPDARFSEDMDFLPHRGVQPILEDKMRHLPAGILQISVI